MGAFCAFETPLPCGHSHTLVTAHPVKVNPATASMQQKHRTTMWQSRTVDASG